MKLLDPNKSVQNSTKSQTIMSDLNSGPKKERTSIHTLNLGNTHSKISKNLSNSTRYTKSLKTNNSSHKSTSTDKHVQPRQHPYKLVYCSLKEMESMK